MRCRRGGPEDPVLRAAVQSTQDLSEPVVESGKPSIGDSSGDGPGKC